MKVLGIRLGLAGVVAAAMLALMLLTPVGGGGSALAVPSSAFCDPSPPVPINDVSTATVDCEVQDPGSIKDLNVFVDLDHSFIGDLNIHVTHLDSGSTATLLANPLCVEDDISATFDDEATDPAQLECNTTPPAIDGSVSPVSPLSVFDGESFEGTWRLTVNDKVALDSGQINSFRLFAETNHGIKKDPHLANLWLCTEQVANCSNFESGVGVVLQELRLNEEVTGLDPKCTGFPNFAPPETCDRQTIGSFEFEVRFDAKLVRVAFGLGDLFAGSLFDCAVTNGEGFAQVRCNTKGKDGPPITGPGTLLTVGVFPTPDVFSILRANQLNGIATQLINQDCQLSDTQGHPIELFARFLEGDPCADSAITIRRLEGDVHSDCEINVHDQQQIAFRWGSRLGSLLYNENYDLEPSLPKKGDGDIDAKDLQLVYGRFGSTCKAPHPAQDPVDPKAKVGPAPTTDG